MSPRTYALISFVEWLQGMQEAGVRQGIVLDRAGLTAFGNLARGVCTLCSETIVIIERTVAEQERQNAERGCLCTRARDPDTDAIVRTRRHPACPVHPASNPPTAPPEPTK